MPNNTEDPSYNRAVLSITTKSIDVGNPEHTRPIQVNNTTALELASKKGIPNATKLTDMDISWMRDHLGKNQFRHYWGPGRGNRMAYWKMHFCEAHYSE